MDDEPLVIHRRARNPKQVVEKPVRIRRRKEPHTCKQCEQRAKEDLLEATRAMQSAITTAYVGSWSVQENGQPYTVQVNADPTAAWSVAAGYVSPYNYTIGGSISGS